MVFLVMGRSPENIEEKKKTKKKKKKKINEKYEESQTTAIYIFISLKLYFVENRSLKKSCLYPYTIKLLVFMRCRIFERQ